MRLRLGRAVCLLRWSEPGNKPRAVTPGGPPEVAAARGDQHPARSGDRQGPQLHLLAQARRPPSVHPGDLQYLEHGTGPLAAELDRLWWVRGTGKRRTARDGGWPWR